MSTLEIWMRLADEVALGRPDNEALYDAIRAASDDIHAGYLPYEHPKLFVDTLWALAQVELSLSAQLLFDIVAIKNNPDCYDALMQFMRDVQQFDAWIDFHKAIDAAHHVVDKALGHPCIGDTH